MNQTVEKMNSPISNNSEAVSSPKYRKFYWPEARKDRSPKFCGIQDRAEVIGWDDSPEPLKFDTKATVASSRKILDPAASPRSSHHRPKPRPAKPALASAELIQDLSAINELAQRVLSRQSNSSSSNIDPLLQDNLAETLIACTQQVESKTMCPEAGRRSLTYVNTTSGSSSANPTSAKTSNAGVSSSACKISTSVPFTTTTVKPLNTITNGLKIQSSVLSPSADVKPHQSSILTKLSPSAANATDANFNFKIKRGPCYDDTKGFQPTFSPQNGFIKKIWTDRSSSTASASSPNSSPRTVDLSDSSRSSSSRNSPFRMYSYSTAGVQKPSSTSGSSDNEHRSPVVKQQNDSAFDDLLKSFREEKDEWLSQVDISTDTKTTPGKSKGGFYKCRSDNQLQSPGRNNFRRAASFHQSDTVEPQPLKKQKSFHIAEPLKKGQCTQEEVERKRNEALFRRKQREIEQKKLEAQKRRMEKEKLSVLMHKVVHR